MTDTAGQDEEFLHRILILAPLGGDAQALGRLLSRSGLTVLACKNAQHFTTELQGGVGAVLLTEEALSPPVQIVLRTALLSQKPWSDIPLLLLVDMRGGMTPSNPFIKELRTSGNLTVLDRPTRAMTLVTALRSALRARKRQYEVKELLQREAAARADAEAATRVRDEFLANVSHELRTPLSAILGWTQFLQSGRVPPERSAKPLEAIERSAKAQVRLIEDLVDITRMSTGGIKLNLEECDPSVVAMAAADIIKPVIEEKGLKLDVRFSRSASIVQGDPDRLQQVILNLLSNSAKFTDRGGSVVLRVDQVNGHAKIEVADTGRGIRRDLLPHVFDRFRQAHSHSRQRHEGLGLGLAIARQLIEGHGGTLYAESEGEGQGATFVIELPVVEGHRGVSTTKNIKEHVKTG